MLSKFRTQPLPIIPQTITALCLGPTNIGKTTQMEVVNKQLLMRTLPSGLQFTPGDPREVSKAINDFKMKLQLLRTNGSPTTLKPNLYQHVLSEGDRPLVKLNAWDIIGQVINNTTTDSAAEEQQKYEVLMKMAEEADVILVGLSLGEPQNFEDNLNLVTAYLYEGLRRRTNPRPAAVLIQCLKADAAYATEEELKREFTEDLIRSQFHGLITLINRSPKVGEAAAVATSTLGFGKVIARNQDSVNGEPTYVLKQGETPHPYNLMTVVLWSIIGGLLHKDGGSQKEPPELVRICKDLATDLSILGNGFIPLKGHLQLKHSV